VRDAIAASIAALPDQLRRSLTWDQGAEIAQHAQLRIQTGLAIYFCDPHSPWQRGTNENTNGLLRQCFPRAPTSASTPPATSPLSPRPSTAAPRKTLGWRTPAEALNELLHSGHQAGVATTP
jgi:IS30 family transposase